VTLESLVALSFLSMFFAILPFAHNNYAVQYQIQAGTRNRALDTASRNCTAGATPQYYETGDQNADAQRVANESGDRGATTATSTMMNTTQASDSRVVKIGPFSQTVTADSHAICNDLPSNSSAKRWVEKGADDSQGGGI
jgi:hypothetical protein